MSKDVSESFEKFLHIAGGGGVGECDLLPDHAASAGGGSASQLPHHARSGSARGLLDLSGAMGSARVSVPSASWRAFAERAAAVELRLKSTANAKDQHGLHGFNGSDGYIFWSFQSSAPAPLVRCHWSGATGTSEITHPLLRTVLTTTRIAHPLPTPQSAAADKIGFARTDFVLLGEKNTAEGRPVLLHFCPKPCEIALIRSKTDLFRPKKSSKIALSRIEMVLWGNPS